MKYVNISPTPTPYEDLRLGFDLEVACSECGNPVDPNSKYCSECGHRLRSIPVKISFDGLISVINAQIRSSGPEKTVPENDVPKKDVSRKTSPNTSDGHNAYRCTLGKTASEAPSCPHRKDCDCCDGYTYLTFPPQPGKCPFFSKSNGHFSVLKDPDDPGFWKGDLQDF